MQETLVQILGQEDPLEKGEVTHEKNPSAMQETLVQTLVQILGQEDLREKGEVTHASILVLPW